MSGRQTVVLWAGVALGVVMGLVPPWKHTRNYSVAGRSEQSEHPAGYAFIGTPPELVPITSATGQFGVGVRIDVARLAVQYAVLTIVTAALLVTGRRSTFCSVCGSKTINSACARCRSDRPASSADKSGGSAPPQAVAPGPPATERPAWYCIRPLTNAASRLMYVVLLLAAPLDLLVRKGRLPDPTTSGGLGELSGTFVALAIFGWLVGAFLWVASGGSKGAAAVGFLVGMIGLGTCSLIGQWQIDALDKREALQRQQFQQQQREAANVQLLPPGDEPTSPGRPRTLLGSLAEENERNRKLRDERGQMPGLLAPPPRPRNIFDIVTEEQEAQHNHN